ncbi:MAG: SDR family oxidoreductase [Stappiaceae bacterium]
MFFESLAGKTVVITGGAGGIGTPLARNLARIGADMLILDWDQARLDRLVTELSGGKSTIVALQSDLADFSACQNLIAQAPSELIGLVHLAGVFEQDEDDAADHTVWDRAIDHNLKNARDMCLAFADAAPKDSEIARKIVLTSSLAANRGAFDHYSYTAAKAGLIGLTRAFARRFAPDMIVNCIAPGIILTGMPDKVLADRREKVLSEIPLKRFGQPEEVASVIMFLISDAVSYVSGQMINIDGGTING